MLGMFGYAHLPQPLQEISKEFHDLAVKIVSRTEGAETTAGLRKLLEAKDCIVRANGICDEKIKAET
jgi:hypothetical protein